MTGKFDLFGIVNSGDLMSNHRSSWTILWKSIVNSLIVKAVPSLLKCAGNKLNPCPFLHMLSWNFRSFILFVFLFVLLSFVVTSLTDCHAKYWYQSCYNKASMQGFSVFSNFIFFTKACLCSISSLYILSMF